MKYINLFQDTIAEYPELLSTVFVASKPWFPNSSLSGNIPPEETASLKGLCENEGVSAISVINNLVLKKSPEEYIGSLFLWCEGPRENASLCALSYTEEAWIRNPEHPYRHAQVGGSLFAFQPEPGTVREVKFMRDLMLETWGDPSVYDIAISFAKPERDYVRELADFLKSRNVLVFFDEYEQAEMWGQDGLEYLQKAYVEKARYVVICISEEYMERAWPTYERKQILGREFIKQDTTILPLRFDEAEIPALPPQYFHLDARNMDAQSVGAVIIEKLSK